MRLGRLASEMIRASRALFNRGFVHATPEVIVYELCQRGGRNVFVPVAQYMRIDRRWMKGFTFSRRFCIVSYYSSPAYRDVTVRLRWSEAGLYADYVTHAPLPDDTKTKLDRVLAGVAGGPRAP